MIKLFAPFFLLTIQQVPAEVFSGDTQQDPLWEESAVQLAAAPEPVEAAFHPPSDAEVSISANTQDTYHWSSKNERYELKKASFRVLFRLSSDSKNLGFPISQASRTDRAEKNSVRSLVVYHPNSVVFSSFLNGQKVREYTTYAQMDDNEENMSLAFPTPKVKELFIKSLQLVAFGEVTQAMQPDAISSSQYHCRIQGQNLVCSMEYSTKARLSEVLPVLSAKKRDRWLDIIKKNSQKRSI